MFVEDLILRNTNSSKPFKLVVSRKFYIKIKPNDFHRSPYRTILKNYMCLMVEDEQIELTSSYKIKKYYVESKELEKDLLEFENKWYNKKLGKDIEKEE